MLARMAGNIAPAQLEILHHDFINTDVEFSAEDVAIGSVAIARAILKECGIEEEVKLSLKQIKDDSIRSVVGE